MVWECTHVAVGVEVEGGGGFPSPGWVSPLPRWCFASPYWEHSGQVPTNPLNYPTSPKHQLYKCWSTNSPSWIHAFTKVESIRSHRKYLWIVMTSSGKNPPWLGKCERGKGGERTVNCAKDSNPFLTSFAANPRTAIVLFLPKLD